MSLFLEEAVLQTPCLSFQKQTGYKALEVGEISALTVAAFWFSPIIRTSGKISLVPANKGTLKKKKNGEDDWGSICWAWNMLPVLLHFSQWINCLNWGLGWVWLRPLFLHLWQVFLKPLKYLEKIISTLMGLMKLWRGKAAQSNEFRFAETVFLKT